MRDRDHVAATHVSVETLERLGGIDAFLESLTRIVRDERNL
jgi:hypothetical protein